MDLLLRSGILGDLELVGLKCLAKKIKSGVFFLNLEHCSYHKHALYIAPSTPTSLAVSQSLPPLYITCMRGLFGLSPGRNCMCIE